MGKSSIEVIAKLLHEMEVRIVRIECRLEAMEARMREISEDMRKILERCGRRWWLA